MVYYFICQISAILCLTLVPVSLGSLPHLSQVSYTPLVLLGLQCSRHARLVTSLTQLWLLITPFLRKGHLWHYQIFELLLTILKLCLIPSFHVSVYFEGKADARECPGIEFFICFCFLCFSKNPWNYLLRNNMEEKCYTSYISSGNSVLKCFI